MNAGPKPMPRLADFARRAQGVLRGTDAPFERVMTDSRQARRGDLFVALRGERFDGHAFLSAVADAGAAGAVVARAADGAFSQIVVADPLAALQAFAHSWRGDFHIPLVGVTGSAGKTTTRQLAAAVFAELGPVCATQGNLNNHIGVPLTLCRLRTEHRAAVIEMGANHAGEIALLADIARPTIGIVTLAGDAHLEGFGSRDGVAHAKGEMFAALNDNGTAVINADDFYAPLWRRLAGRARIIHFGLDRQAEVAADDVRLDDAGSRFVLRVDLDGTRGEAPVRLALPGRHNVRNALAAAAAGLVAGVPLEAVARRLADARPIAGRGVWMTAANGARILDDSYNANPTSVRAGLEVLARRPGTRIALLGDMAELGPEGLALHEAVGRQARALGIDVLCTVGSLSRATALGFGAGARHFDDVETAVAALRDLLGPDVSLLVKASHSAHLERVVAALTGATEGVH
ncbi:MAG TPA: UDP-N-acetylmuramoyl-tripeptide--D-alanyl-D-alanine ligase [Burkholderiaceae bacterium]